MRFGASAVNFNLDIPVSYVLRCCDWVRAPDRLSSINLVRLQATGVLLSAGVTRNYGGRKCYFIITDGVSILSIFREYHGREENAPFFFSIARQANNSPLANITITPTASQSLRQELLHGELPLLRSTIALAVAPSGP